MYDLIIVGGGPAGLTATIYALRKRMKVLLITRDLGGKTNYRLQVPNVEQHLVITGEEVVNRFVNEIEYLDFAREMDKVEKIDRTPQGYTVLTRGEKQYNGKALLVATGANAHPLDVPGEKEYMMRGLCYSAVSYAPLFVERPTVVIGDSDLALRAAAELARIASAVTLVAPTHGDLDSGLGQRLRASPNVLVMEGYEIKEVKGDEFARELVVQKNGEAHSIRADAFFVELGLKPNSNLVKHLADVDEDGYIKVDMRNHTSAPGLFAAGDVTNAYAEQVLIAIGEGAKAALSAYEYLLSQPMEESATTAEWR